MADPIHTFYVGGHLVKGGGTPETRLAAALEALQRKAITPQQLKDFCNYPGNLIDLTPTQARTVVEYLMKASADAYGQATIVTVLAALRPDARGQCLRLIDGEANERRVDHLLTRAVTEPALRVRLLQLVDAARPHMAKGERIMITDLDDTIVPSDYHPEPGNKKRYPGEAAFFRALDLGNDGAGVLGDVHVVTARGISCAGEAEHFLRGTGIEWGSVAYSRPLGSYPSTAAKHDAIARRKKESIHKLLQRNPQSRAVLVGDSTQADAAVYYDMINTYGDRIEAVFIHRVGKFNIPDAILRHPKVILFDTYADAARAAFDRHMINAVQLADVIADR